MVFTHLLGCNPQVISVPFKWGVPSNIHCRLLPKAFWTDSPRRRSLGRKLLRVPKMKPHRHRREQMLIFWGWAVQSAHRWQAIVSIYSIYKFSYHAMVVIYLYTVDFTCGASNGLYFGADHTLQSWHMEIPSQNGSLILTSHLRRRVWRKSVRNFTAVQNHSKQKIKAATSEICSLWSFVWKKKVEVIGEQASYCLSFHTPSVGNRETWDPACLTGLKRKASSCSRGARKLRA